jgi:tRNA-binding protein
MSDERPYEPSNLPRRDDVSVGEFFALDIRAGRIVDVDDFPEARKPAYKISVDFGPAVGVLTTSAQVAHYEKDELRDRMVIGAINLGEKRIAGFKSQFLILGTLDPDGRVRLLQVEPGAEPGAPVA